MERPKVGVQLHPQHTTVEELRRAWREADSAGVDTLWLWDHFFPLQGDPGGAHFEGWTLLAAMAADTERARIGVLVTCNSYRNPDLLADMARTVDHISGGRLVLGIGAGWYRRDYEAYGYDFGTASSRLAALGDALPRIKRRLSELTPKPQGDVPIMIGGGGEKVTLRLVAEHAQWWNGFGPPAVFRRKNEVLDHWCEEAGRKPSGVVRTVAIQPDEVPDVGAYLEAGAQHVFLQCPHPFDLGPARRLLDGP